ncbi:MAG: hypothetical protein A2W52_04810 [Candidatus Taylorbacteria bacterium RIFCSPHIGHO2_02_49_25]|uniref:Uncharacterized protein n=1 Tax=Candidatus Taylorbacteria bacterium RIFCSPHIGHO2_02_49_25 TaxID=1802305 RepID=A0A1G2MEV5_9BACT|nr:MAG: hypothetical protein UY62_C0058G0006 [Parcubacteria group bacterium GW2011_GWF2_50_9]OHA22363.1 MAG: hypothetical protein A2W52_04810 [Candidatus Taylorbacteria bacterium RIFCSPHIGHO2_02_49_25]OHA35843.1 MAG: hypothetical protein A2W65_03570 [Candidatus Taylorbacteria bacterium RIFCSPLOWO2_02_50_13]OHA37163.1 MAG: hypothetical protein A3B27_02640 [Candidatus Taylorbacteria bacterium RIFCSPLOWO2_01_FULL_50_130]OHA40572.1 MAG: hypothetical protein A3H73_02725 [Candidatus Taylorbacteria ba
MDNKQGAAPSQNANQSPATGYDNGGQMGNTGEKPEQQSEPQLGAGHQLPTVLILVAVAIGILVILALLPKKDATPKTLGVDKNGVPILILDKNQVIEKVTSGKPLDEPEVRAVFRWAVEHPNEAARLSPEEKADIIRALNE